jgi:MbtH protein
VNPFDDQNSKFHVLVNSEGQYCLWPVHIEVPAGWRVVVEASDRDKCITFIENNWRDMQPMTLKRGLSYGE